MKHTLTPNVLAAMRESITEQWVEPHITYSNCDDADTLEWWKGSKGVTVWVDVNGEFEGLRVWGININDEMSSFYGLCAFKDAYDWLCT